MEGGLDGSGIIRSGRIDDFSGIYLNQDLRLVGKQSVQEVINLRS